MIEKVKRLQKLKELKQTISEEEEIILNEINDLVIFKNDDNTWTRFKKIDNIKEIQENGQIFRPQSIKRFTTEIKVLKNEPKELKNDK